MNGAVGSPEVSRASLGRKILRGLGIFVVLFVMLFVAGVIWRMPIVAEEDSRRNTESEISRAHIGLRDVDGTHIPPTPDTRLSGAKVLGVDANKNGIRDDVELAIFEAHPVEATTSSKNLVAYGDANFKIRAAELQFAKGLEFALRGVDDSDSWVLSMQLAHDGQMCIAHTYIAADSEIDQAVSAADVSIKRIEALVFNTPARIKKLHEVQIFKSVVRPEKVGVAT